MSITFDRIPESSTPTPDYKVIINGEQSYWEVKELGENQAEENILKDIENGSGEIYSVNSKRVENSIKSAAKQFKGFGVTNSPCIVVICDSRSFATMDIFFSEYVKAAMFGIAEYMLESDGTMSELSRKDGLLTKRKGYISAIAIISRYSKGITFLHNPNANYPVLDKWISLLFSNHHQAKIDTQGLRWVKV